MKFSNGCWLQKERTECFGPAEVFETKRDDNSITFCAPTHKINHRGDTLGGPNLTIKISAPMPEVIRVQTFHYMGVIDHGPNFELEIDENASIVIEDLDGSYKLSSGSLNLVINKSNATMQFNRDDYKLTDSKWRDLAYIKTDFKGLAYEKIGRASCRERVS